MQADLATCDDGRASGAWQNAAPGQYRADPGHQRFSGSHGPVDGYSDDPQGHDQIRPIGPGRQHIVFWQALAFGAAKLFAAEDVKCAGRIQSQGRPASAAGEAARHMAPRKERRRCAPNSGGAWPAPANRRVTVWSAQAAAMAAVSPCRSGTASAPAKPAYRSPRMGQSVTAAGAAGQEKVRLMRTGCFSLALAAPFVQAEKMPRF